jgi:hypothetical protein
MPVKEASLLAMVAGLIASGCGGFVGEMYISRQARLIGRVEIASGRTGVPCRVTVRMFGRDDREEAIASGQGFSLTVSMTTPLRLRTELRPRVALRVGCEGHRMVTTAEQETDIGWVRTPTTDFGSIRVPAESGATVGARAAER